MTIFSVSTSLIGPSQLHYGFWYSYDSTQAQGYMLTLSNFVASYLSLALGLLVGWAVSRLWRVCCALLFYFSYSSGPSWEESQNNILIVNSNNAVEGCIDSYGILRSRSKAYRRHEGGEYSLRQGRKPPTYLRARYVVISVMLVALVAIGLKLAIPLLIAIVPATKLGIVMSKDCGILSLPPGQPSLRDTAETFMRDAKWANAAFAMLDRSVIENPVEFGRSALGTGRTALPEQAKSFIYSCPTGVPACSAQHPFTFSSHYTLFSRHFGLNIDNSFSLGVSESCYRPRSAAAFMDPVESGSAFDLPYANSTMYGLYYGPVTGLTGSTQKPTFIVNALHAQAGGYTLHRIRALANNSFPYGWSPNSTLLQGGDTALLLYYIGGVIMTNRSFDPVFATLNVPDSPNIYFSQSLVIPIICDTKYVFCDADKNGKALLGQSLLAVSLAAPPIFRAAYGSAAILAAQTADGLAQYAPENITAFGELGRLSTAGMVMLGSYAQLSVTGYWNKGIGAIPFTTEADPASLCNKVFMESSAATTIPVIPYLLFLIFSIIVVLASYSGSFRLSRRLLSQSLDRLFKSWTLHRPGQLHREVTERLRGRDFKTINMIRQWPDAPYQSGPSIITQRGTERFGSGNTGLLQGNAEEYPLKTIR